MPYKIGIDARRLNEPGIGDHVLNLVGSLADLDEENSYVLFVGASYDDEFEHLPANFTRIVERSPVYSLRERAALSWRLFRQRLDLYHATHYVLPLWVPRRTVTTVHDVVHLLNPNFIPGRLAKLTALTQIRYSLNRSNRITVTSDHAIEDLAEYFDLSTRSVRRIYPGVSALFSPDPTAADSGHLKELGVETPYVLFEATHRTYTNEERMLRAYASATRALDDRPKLVMLGERELPAGRFDEIARQLGILDSIVACNPQPPAIRAALIRACELYVYPTLYECFPTPVIEAMGCGAPIVTSDRTTIREIAQGAAKLVEPSSVESLTSAIGWCLQDDGLQRTLAADALERAAGFRWPRVAEQTLALYLDTLNNGDERRRLLRRERRS